jgi:hypothetical protein
MPFYLLFVALLAFRPLIKPLIGTLAGLAVGFQSAIAFMWVGVCSSLPASLGAAKAFGNDEVEAYWRYLESFPNGSHKRVMYVWAGVSLASLVLGTAVLLIP